MKSIASMYRRIRATMTAKGHTRARVSWKWFEVQIVTLPCKNHTIYTMYFPLTQYITIARTSDTMYDYSTSTFCVIVRKESITTYTRGNVVILVFLNSALFLNINTVYTRRCRDMFAFVEYCV